MAKRSFSAEQAYEILAADGSNGELPDSDSSANSDAKSDVNYEPIVGSGTETSEEEEEEEE